jgi:hypothetical protein
MLFIEGLEALHEFDLFLALYPFTMGQHNKKALSDSCPSVLDFPASRI